MSGLPDYNYPAFAAKASELRAKGYKVLDPSEIPEKPDWQGYMRESIKMVAQATHIYMPDGWESSKGALLENLIAEQLGIERIDNNL